MWPWLVGAGVLGLLVLSGGGSSSASAEPPAPSSPATTSKGAMAKPPDATIPPSSVEAAFHVALSTEKSAAALSEFGTALVTYGYASEGAALLNKAATLSSKGHPVQAPPSPSGGGGSTFQQYPYGSPAATNTIQWWVNHYAKATPPYANGETIHPADITLAVHNALAHPAAHDVDDLTEFVTELDWYGYHSQAATVASHVLALQVSLLQPYVTRYAGTSTVDEFTISKTVDALKAHGTPTDQANFGMLLEGGWQRGFSDFSMNWLTDGQELVALGKKGGARPS